VLFTLFLLVHSANHYNQTKTVIGSAFGKQSLADTFVCWNYFVI